MKLTASVSPTASTPHPTMLEVSPVATITTRPATAIAALTANRTAAALRQPRLAAAAGTSVAARPRRGCMRIATPTMTMATSIATGNPTSGPPSRIAAMIGTAIANGKANSIHAGFLHTGVESCPSFGLPAHGGTAVGQAAVRSVPLSRAARHGQPDGMTARSPRLRGLKGLPVASWSHRPRPGTSVARRSAWSTRIRRQPGTCVRTSGHRVGGERWAPCLDRDGARSCGCGCGYLIDGSVAIGAFR
jgi:hypothetical protein